MSFEDSLARKMPPPPKKKREVVVELDEQDLEELEDDPLEERITQVWKNPTEIKKVESKENLQFEIGAASRASIEHPERNEDAYYTSPKRGIVGVFDGMGGIPAGDMAAHVAVRQLSAEEMDRNLKEAKTVEQAQTAELIKNVFASSKETVQRQEDVEAATRALLERMNREVEKLGQTNAVVREKAMQYFPKLELGSFDPWNEEHKRQLDNILQSIGSTVSFMKIWRREDGKDMVTVGNLGDSRIYRLRNDELTKLTRDDSHVQILIEAGVIQNDQDVTQRIDKAKIIELADTHPELRALALKLIRSADAQVTLRSFRNMVTQAAGIATFAKNMFGTEFKPQAKSFEMESGDVYIGVTDGVSDDLTDTEIQDTVTLYRNEPEKIAARLQRAATERSMTTHPRAKPDDVTAVAALYRKN